MMRNKTPKPIRSPDSWSITFDLQVIDIKS
jgi:hypothetical protein